MHLARPETVPLWASLLSLPIPDLAADGMALAERVNDPGMLMEALFMPGVTKFYRAEFADARAVLRKGDRILR